MLPHDPDPSCAVKSQSALCIALEMPEHAHHAHIDLNRAFGGRCVCAREVCLLLYRCPEE